MNKAAIIKGHVAGLGSIINNVIAWAHVYPQIHVDWSGCLYGPNTFETLFQPLPEPEEPFDTVCVHEPQWLTYRNAADLYLDRSVQHADWRATCHEQWERWFVPRLAVLDFVEEFVRKHFSTRVIAALVRAHGHAGEQIYPHKSQTLDQYAEAISREFYNGNTGYVYVAASDTETLDWFKARFPVLHHPTARRGLNRDADFHRKFKQTEQDAVDALAEIMIMSRADVLIHPVSNMATCALYFNPQLRSVYLP